MGRMLASDIITEIRNTYGQLDTTTYPDADLLVYINTAYLSDVCAAQWNLPELDSPISVTAGSGVALCDLTQTDFIKINEVYRVADSYRMEGPVSRMDMVRLGGLYTTQTGPPEKWWPFWNATTKVPSLGIWPKTDKAYALQVDVRRRPAVLDTGDATDLAEVWDEAVKAFALSRMARRLRLLDEAQNHWQYAVALSSQAGGVESYGSTMYRSATGAQHYGSRPGGE